MALRTLTTVDLIYFDHVWGPAYQWIEIHWNNIWLRVMLDMTSHYTWGYVTTLRDLAGVSDCLWTLSRYIWCMSLECARNHVASLECSNQSFHAVTACFTNWPNCQPRLREHVSVLNNIDLLLYSTSHIMNCISLVGLGHCGLTLVLLPFG